MYCLYCLAARAFEGKVDANERDDGSISPLEDT